MDYLPIFKFNFGNEKINGDVFGLIELSIRESILPNNEKVLIVFGTSYVCRRNALSI